MSRSEVDLWGREQSDRYWLALTWLVVDRCGPVAEPQISGWLGLASSNLSFLDFVEGLAVHAQIGGRTSLQSADANFDTALVAEAVIVFFDTNQCFINFLD